MTIVDRIKSLCRRSKPQQAKAEQAKPAGKVAEEEAAKAPESKAGETTEQKGDKGT